MKQYRKEKAPTTRWAGTLAGHPRPHCRPTACSSLGQQHRHGHPAEYHGLRRHRPDMRERSRHHLHRHRLGTRPLERHHAQGLRPRPPLLQPPHRPRIPRSEAQLPLRPALGHSRPGETAHPHRRKRPVLAPALLLHARHPQVQNQFDRQDTDLETVFTGLGMQCASN